MSPDRTATLRAEPASDPSSEFLVEVSAGLLDSPKSLAPKYFYDETGSRLFDRICELPEYYLTRTELAIMRAHAGSMAQALGPDLLLIEPGSGSSVKIRLLLERLDRPVAYVPVEICREHMLASVAALQADYPALEILPVCADFTRSFPVPAPSAPARRRAVYFPGSTLGNFPPPAAAELLTVLHQAVGPGGALILGVDLEKSPDILLPAYDDAAGVTAAFNRNLLTRINRELGGDFDPHGFAHRAVWNADEGRIEMHLVSGRRQTAHVGGQAIEFAAGEPIVTEYSYKYTPARLAAMAERAGFRIERSWTDSRQWFGVYCLVR